uniref:Uncharacterized protein n=1 Tax=Rhizophagus irregularis (strain DAOM 181602 / DAOM 197198 / MUCL 43194) TaxID=747089 RepID=U9SZN9_RHIID
MFYIVYKWVADMDDTGRLVIEYKCHKSFILNLDKMNNIVLSWKIISISILLQFNLFKRHCLTEVDFLKVLKKSKMKIFGNQFFFWFSKDIRYRKNGFNLILLYIVFMITNQMISAT